MSKKLPTIEEVTLFCRFCSGRLEDNGEYKQCAVCKKAEYFNPKSNLSLIIFRFDGQHDYVLLSRRKQEPRPGGWQIVGGFPNKRERKRETLRRHIQNKLGPSTGLNFNLAKQVYDCPQEYEVGDHTIELNCDYYVLPWQDGGEVTETNLCGESKWFRLDQIPEAEIDFRSDIEALCDFRAQRQLEG